MRGELMWTCLVWAERSSHDSFWVPSHRFNSTTGEQKGITQTIYTDSEPPSRFPNSLMPSANPKNDPPPQFLRLWIEPRTPSPRADALTTMRHGGGVKLMGGFSVLATTIFSLKFTLVRSVCKQRKIVMQCNALVDP